MVFLQPMLATLDATEQVLAQQILSEAMQDRRWREAFFDTTRCEILSSKVVDHARRALQGHSRQYWFQVLRRVPPHRWPSPRCVNMASRLILTCAGPGTVEEWVSDPSGRGVFYVVDAELAERVLLIMCLAVLAHEVEGLYRVAGKGIRIYNPPEFKPIEFSLNASVRSYERRRDRFETLAGCAGIWFDAEQVKPVQPRLSTVWGAYFYCVIKNKNVVECFCGCANPSASTTRETPRGIFGLAGASRGAC
jgi:hypothetical protein